MYLNVGLAQQAGSTMAARGIFLSKFVLEPTSMRGKILPMWYDDLLGVSDSRLHGKAWLSLISNVAPLFFVSCFCSCMRTLAAATS